jgi:hypothetical protein
MSAPRSSFGHVLRGVGAAGKRASLADRFAGFFFLRIQRISDVAVPNRAFVFLNYTVQRAHTHPDEYTHIHVRKPYPCEHLRRTEHLQIWRLSKLPLTPRRRRERRLPLNA